MNKFNVMIPESIPAYNCVPRRQVPRSHAKFQIVVIPYYLQRTAKKGKSASDSIGTETLIPLA
eukprot:SAG31_NODE_1404_length_8479_cov_2.258760_10_plen_63_part_00